MKPKTDQDVQNKFNIRDGTIANGDHELLIDLWSSQIQWLSTIGSGDQWGTRPIREARPEVPGVALDFVQRSDRKDDWSLDYCRVYVAETKTNNAPAEAPVPVAAIVLEGKAYWQVRSLLPEQDEKDPFLYLTYLMSNRDAGTLSKGAGGALIAFAKDQAGSLGCNRLCVHCWRGNDRKLIKYYESQGFRKVSDFDLENPRTKESWPGCLLEARVD